MVYMSTAELKHRYDNMDAEQDRMNILAELNGCLKREIAEKLCVRLEVKPKSNRGCKFKHPDKHDEFLRMYQYGCTDTYIAKRFGLDHKRITYWRNANGFPAARPVGKMATEEERKTWDMLFS